MIDWDTVWKIEKYPLWVKDNEVGKYWDIKTSERYNKMVCTKSIKKNTLQQIEDLNLRKDDIVFDIGCGVGRLSVPIAKIVKKVYALDLSEAMLRHARKYTESEHVHNIEYIHENWENFNIHTIGKVDISISHNSMGVYELKKSLQRINTITKREAFIFTFAGKGEWMDEEIAKLVYGNNILLSYSSALIVFNLLFQMGLLADMHIEKNIWAETYSSLDEACSDIMKLYSIKESLRKNVKRFIQKNSFHSNHSYTLHQKRFIACIHWHLSGKNDF